MQNMESEPILNTARKILANTTLSFMGIGIDLKEVVDSRSVNERISQLGKVKDDLQAAIVAVDELQTKAVQSRSQYEELARMLKRLEEEKATTEALLRIPEESFSRVFAKASSRGRWRGIIEGSVIGFVTGCASSYLIWYATK